MPDSDGGIPRPTRLLVTGFGAFPGTPRNPSATVVAALARYRTFFARRGIALTTEVLPVLYDFCAAFAPAPAPDAIVHVGVAGRRRAVAIETRAHNRRSVRHPDASGRVPNVVLSGQQAHHRIDAGWGAHRLAVALKRAGVPAEPSRDAGAYVCNALLYRSLDGELAPALFIHIPRARIVAPERIARALARTLPDVVARLVRTNARKERM